MIKKTGNATIVLGGGCFWCIEAVFKRVTGITRVVSGYAGGVVEDPSYSEVSTGTTGHAETVALDFDPSEITLAKILDIFFTAHDPTTKNRQGADVGTQYRSIILYRDENQKEEAEAAIVRAKHLYPAPIITEVIPLGTFYPAEDYHQDYYDQNKNTGYCRLIITPKLKKLDLE